MPEYPDITVYVEACERFLVGQTLCKAVVKSPFLIRTVAPDIQETVGKQVVSIRRMGKRIVWCLEDELFLVFHLMIAGRLRWRETPPALRGKNDLASFQFGTGCILFTEASPKKRASLHVVQGETALEALNPGGLEILESELSSFHERIQSVNHTLKRALTDPRLFSGIGNAYSDEILLTAGLSPIKLTSRLTDDEISRLFLAIRETLQEWADRLRGELGDKFPDKVTAFHPKMVVHGKFGKPCKKCGATVQRIVYSQNECNYCPGCQTGGKVLADRSLSRLLKQDWPRGQ